MNLTKFIELCKQKNPNLNEIKEILDNNPQINIIARKNKAFRFACANGNFEVVKWLYSLHEENPDKYPHINISENDEYAFINVCSEGYLEIAKWLVSLHEKNPEKNPKINISAQNDKAFKHACNRLEIDIVEWLIVLDKNSLNISEKKEKAFSIFSKYKYL